MSHFADDAFDEAPQVREFTLHLPTVKQVTESDQQKILRFVNRFKPIIKTKIYDNGVAYSIRLDIGQEGCAFVGGEFRDFQAGILSCMDQLKEIGEGL